MMNAKAAKNIFIPQDDGASTLDEGESWTAGCPGLEDFVIVCSSAGRGLPFRIGVV